MLRSESAGQEGIVIEGGAQNTVSDGVVVSISSQDATVTHEPATEPDELVQKLFGGNLVYINGCFMTYRLGRWVAINEKAEVMPKVAKYYGFSLPVRDVREIVGQLKFRHSAVAMPEPASKLICMTNGVLDPMTGALHAHSPDYYMRNMVNVTWDGTATCPTWERFLDDVFRDDEDKADKIQFTKQWFGYCLLPLVDMHKMLMLFGDGENGKSVFIELLSHVVGKQNTSHIAVEHLGKMETLVDLESKLINISPEISSRAWQNSSNLNNLKSIVVGNNLQARQRYGDPVTFKPTARIVVSTNNLPKVYDQSHGFFRRIIILKFNRRFTDTDRNRQIENDLLAELPGIFTWAVRGLQDLLQKRDFDIPASSNAAIEDYKVESDDVQMFLAECCFVNDGEGLLPPVVYTAYCKWAKDAGLTALNKFAFGKRFKLAGVSQRHTRHGDKWQVRFKNDQATNVVPLLPVLAA